MAPPRRNGYAANYDLKSRKPVVLQQNVTAVTLLPSKSARVDLPRQIPRDPRYSESDEDLDYKGYDPNAKVTKKRYLHDFNAPAANGYDPLNQNNHFFGSSDGTQTVVNAFDDGDTTSSNPLNNIPVPNGTNAHRISKDCHPIPNPGMLVAHEATKQKINKPSIGDEEGTSVIAPQRHRNLNTYNVANARIPAGARAAPYSARPVPPAALPTRRVTRRSAASSTGGMDDYPEHVKSILREGMKEFERERGLGSEDVEMVPPHLMGLPIITPTQFLLGLKALEDPEDDLPNMKVEIPSSMPTLNAYDNGLSSNRDNRSVYSSHTPSGTPIHVHRVSSYQPNVTYSESVASSVMYGYLPGYEAPPSSEISSGDSARSVSAQSSAYGSNIIQYAPPASEASSRHSVISESRVSSLHAATFRDHRSEASSRHSARINHYRERSRSPTRSHYSRTFPGRSPSTSPVRSHSSRSSSLHSAFRAPVRNHASYSSPIHSPSSSSPVRSHGSGASSSHSTAGRRSLSPDAPSFQPRHRYRTRSHSNAARAAALAADAAEQAARSLTGNDRELIFGDDLGDSDSDGEIDIEGYHQSPQVDDGYFDRREGRMRF